MKWNSVHEYLEEAFNGMEPNKDMIIDAKLAYRKLYLKAYRKKYKESFVQVSFCLTREERKHLKDLAKAHDMKVSVFIKNLISGQQINGRLPRAKEISVMLLRAIDMVEELIEEYDREELHELLEQIENAYTSLNDY